MHLRDAGLLGSVRVLFYGWRNSRGQGCALPTWQAKCKSLYFDIWYWFFSSSFSVFLRTFSECFPVISGVSADLIAWPICKHFLYVFNRNVRLSVLDKYPQVYHLSTQGAQNSFPSPRGAFVGLASQTKFQTQIQMWNTRNQCSFCPSVFCFIL